MAKTKTAKEVEALEARIAELEATRGDTRDTSATDQTYPEIHDAPPVTEGEWAAGGPATAAPDQTYPAIEPAPAVVSVPSVEERLSALEAAVFTKKKK